MLVLSDMPATNTMPAVASSPADSQKRAGRRIVLRSAISRPRSTELKRLSRARSAVALLGLEPPPWWSIAARTVIRLALISGIRASSGGSSSPAASTTRTVQLGGARLAGVTPRKPRKVSTASRPSRIAGPNASSVAVAATSSVIVR